MAREVRSGRTHSGVPDEGAPHGNDRGDGSNEAVQNSPESGRFGIDVLKLGAGTAATQLLAVAVSPLLTRLYGPEAFGTLALFSALIGIISVVACLGYELAIMLPESDEEAASLLWVSLGSAVVVAALSGALLYIGRYSISSWLGAPELAPYILLAPVAVFLAGTFVALNSWNSRTRRFGRLSIARINAAAVTVIAQLWAGFTGWASGGALIAASLTGSAVSTCVLGGQIWHDDRSVLRLGRDPTKMLRVMRIHRKFPLINTWSGVINSISWQLPAIMLSALFSIQVAGYFALAFRMLSLPMSLLAASISQVFFQRAAVARRAGSLPGLVSAVYRRLLEFSLFPCIIIFVMGPTLFAHIFGEQWTEAGVYARILSPWLILWFVSSPMNNLFSVLSRQGLGLVVNIALITTRFGSLLLGRLANSVTIGLLLFSLTGAVVYGWLSFAVLRHSGSSITLTLRPCLPAAVLAVALGGLLALVYWSGASFSLCLSAIIGSSVLYYAVVISRDKMMLDLVRQYFYRRRHA